MPQVLLLAEQTGKTNSGMGVYTHEVTRRLVPYLIGKGIETCVVLQDSAEQLISEVEKCGSEMIVLRVSSAPKWKRLWDLARFGVTKKFDLLYSTDFKIPRRLRSIPFVPTIHDLCGLECAGEFGIAKRLFVGSLNKPVMRRAARIISISQQTKKCVEKFYGIAPDNIEVIYNGFNKMGSEKEQPWPAEVTNAKPYFFFPGRISPRKNFGTILKAVKLLVDRGFDCNLVHAGPPGWSNQTDYSLIQSLGLETRLMQLGYVTEEKLHGLYKHATALVYPSFCEGFGLPILESLSAGCPVIVGAGTASEEIGNRFVTVIDPHNASELSYCMEQKLSEAQIDRPAGPELEEHLNSFNWEKTATEVGNLLIEQLN